MSRATVRITEQDYKTFLQKTPQEIYYEDGKVYIISEFEGTARRPYLIEVKYAPNEGRVYFRVGVKMDMLRWDREGVREIIEQLAISRGIKVEVTERGDGLVFVLMCRFKNQQSKYLAKLEQIIMECEYFIFTECYFTQNSDI